MNKDFENMGIYDLRNYARVVGVKAPTTLKRDQLIEKINQIIEGNLPKSEATKKGRPPRHKANDEFLMDIMLPNNMFNSVNSEKTIFDVPFANKSFALRESNINDSQNIEYRGYLSEFNVDYGIVYNRGYLTENSFENVFIQKDLIDSNNLKIGDFVVGNAKYFASKNVYIANDVCFVNSKSCKNDFERKNFNEIPPTYPKEILPLFDNKNSNNCDLINHICPLAKGARVAVNQDNESKKNDLVLNILKTFEENAIHSTIISVGDSPEDIYNLLENYRNIDIVQQNSSQTRENFLNKVDMVIKNCCNRVEFGENVALIFYNANNFLNAMMQKNILLEEMSEVKAKIVAENSFVDIFSLAKSDDNGSLTIICLDSFDALSNIANCRWIFAKSNNIEINSTVDLIASYTKNYDKIFEDKNYIKRLDEFYKTKTADNLASCVKNLFK